MALTAQRFRGQPKLEACAANLERMRAGDPDHEAVGRVQRALTDLGYVVGGVDGRFGDHTGAAVTEFKTHMGLAPTDPVVGPGTMGALDGFFASEPDSLLTIDDDVSDPDLLPTIEADIAATTDFLLTAADLAQGSPDPGTPLRVAVDTAFHVDAASVTDVAVFVDFMVRPALLGAARAYNTGFLVPEAVTAADLAQRFAPPHHALTFGAGSAVLVHPSAPETIAPPDRIRAMCRFGLTISVPNGNRLASPGTPKYALDEFSTARHNVNAFIGFAEHMTTGIPPSFLPDPAWYT